MSLHISIIVTNMISKIRFTRMKKRKIFLTVLLGVNILLASVLLSFFVKEKLAQGPFPEYQELRGNETYEELRVFLVDLAKEKGGRYAYDFLRENEFPSGIDLHLLVHAVGEQMYIQDGLEAMKYCTPELQNGCSHAIVVGDLLEHGESELLKMRDICKKAPGGEAAYPQCFHGLGHGVLTYTTYDIGNTIKLCEKTGGFTESNNCLGGAIMEIVGGGQHDKNLWSEKRTRYITPEDPLSPCNTPVIPEKYKPMCYIYLTPNLFSSGGGPTITDTQNIEKAFSFCNEIPRSKPAERDACFGGFGKEFAIFATGRRINSDYIAIPEELQRAYHWCTLAQDKQGIVSCINYAIDSYYWGGENLVDNAVGFCAVAEKQFKTKCYEKLISLVKYYGNEITIEKVCNSILPQLQNSCPKELVY